MNFGSMLTYIFFESILTFVNKYKEKEVKTMTKFTIRLKKNSSIHRITSWEFTD